MNARVGIAWPVNLHSGWGLLGLNIAVELHRTGARQPVFLGPALKVADPLLSRSLHTVIEGSESWRLPDAGEGQTRDLPYPVLHSIGTDLMRTPVGMPYTGSPNIGIVFIEHSVISKEAIERARSYRLLVAGSQWNLEMLRAAKIGPVTLWQQGVDLSRFHPAPSRRLFRNRFVVFSGGALQLRKGQDIVAKAFRVFHQRHDDALLIAAWGNQYPQIARSILMAAVPSPFYPEGPDKLDIAQWLVALGLPPHSFISLPLMGNLAFPDIMRQADVALFPNRAEGGTNLVAMEAMACGVPCILSPGTGHRDLIELFPSYPLEFAPYGPNPRLRLGHQGWCEVSVEEVVATLEAVYTSPDEARRVGSEAALKMVEWSWEKQVPRLLADVNRVLD